MEKRFDAHHAERKLENALKNLDSIQNGTLIKKFVSEYRYKKMPLSTHRKLSLISRLKFISSLLNKPINTLSSQDIKKLVKNIQEKENKQGKEYSLHTWDSILKDLKVFLKWQQPKKYRDIIEQCKEELTVMNPYALDKKKFTESDLISEETFLKLLKAGNPQQKAILCLLFGCGLRSGELLGLNKPDIKVNEDKTISVSVFGKTGGRKILLKPDLAFHVIEWLNSKKDGQTVFFKQNGLGKRMDYGSLLYSLRETSVSAGLGKWKRTNKKTRTKIYEGLPIFPTLFRRSHATSLLKSMPRTLVNKRIWGNENSDMARVYSRLVDDDVNESYLIASGIKQQTQNKSKIEARYCFKCQQSFPVDMDYCPNCQLPLNPEKIAELLRPNEEIENLKKEMRAIKQLLQLKQEFKKTEVI